MAFLSFFYFHNTDKKTIAIKQLQCFIYLFLGNRDSYEENFYLNSSNIVEANKLQTKVSTLDINESF